MTGRRGWCAAFAAIGQPFGRPSGRAPWFGVVDWMLGSRRIWLFNAVFGAGTCVSITGCSTSTALERRREHRPLSVTVLRTVLVD